MAEHSHPGAEVARGNRNEIAGILRRRDARRAKAAGIAPSKNPGITVKQRVAIAQVRVLRLQHRLLQVVLIRRLRRGTPGENGYPGREEGSEQGR